MASVNLGPALLRLLTNHDNDDTDSLYNNCFTDVSIVNYKYYLVLLSIIKYTHLCVMLCYDGCDILRRITWFLFSQTDHINNFNNNDELLLLLLLLSS